MFVLPWKKNKNTREFVMPEGLNRQEQEEIKEIIKKAQHSMRKSSTMYLVVLNMNINLRFL